MICKIKIKGAFIVWKNCQQMEILTPLAISSTEYTIHYHQHWGILVDVLRHLSLEFLQLRFLFSKRAGLTNWVSQGFLGMLD